MPRSKDELKTALSRVHLSENHQNLLRILYAHPEGLTRRQIAAEMFADGHPHRLAGVLATLSTRLAPGISQDAYRQYLDAQGIGYQERLSLSQALREAMDSSPSLLIRLK